MHGYTYVTDELYIGCIAIGSGVTRLRIYITACVLLLPAQDTVVEVLERYLLKRNPLALEPLLEWVASFICARTNVHVFMMSVLCFYLVYALCCRSLLCMVCVWCVCV